MFTIRRATQTDLDALIELRLALHKGYPDSYIQTYDEVVSRNRDSWSNWLYPYIKGDRGAMFVASKESPGNDGGLLGMVGCLCQECERLCHGATVYGLGVLPGYTRLGIGNALMESLLQWVRTSRKVKRLDLEVFHDNQSAIRLYERCGFNREGQKTNYACKADGQFHHMCCYVLFLG